jgi:hypothetical protein
MKPTGKQLHTEEQLLQARERGLREASEVHVMKAHGKVLGMDTFSWINPDLDMLATVIDSFPFAVHWMGSHDQIARCLELHPELADSLQSIVIYDRTLAQISRELLKKVTNIACVDGTTDALQLLKAMQRGKSVFLFTSTHLNEARNAQFEAFLTHHT